jgi:GH24 family phage-related lysozyme (muramidase)
MPLNDWLTGWFRKTATPVPVLPLAVPGPTSGAWATFQGLLKLREGCRLIAYLDSKGRLTVGIGHLVLPIDGIRLGDTITQARVDTLFQKDAASALLSAMSLCKQAGIASQNFLPFMASVCFQLGDEWPKKFPSMWALVVKGDYAGAALDAGTTAWAKETPVRVADWQGALHALPRKGI